MITDTITNAARYAALHPDFTEAIHLLQTLISPPLPDGQGTAKPQYPPLRWQRTNEEQSGKLLEPHLKHIDILSHQREETYG